MNDDLKVWLVFIVSAAAVAVFAINKAYETKQEFIRSGYVQRIAATTYSKVWTKPNAGGIQ